MEQNGWEALKLKWSCVGIKTKELLKWFYVSIWITLELAEIITLIYNKESFLVETEGNHQKH
jgi:hypothetical protein